MSGSALAGLRVLDLSRLLPGGLCTLVLADLGAEIIKIEHPEGGDYARAREPFHAGSLDPTTASASFRGLNRDKRSVALDLKRPEGVDALLALVADADVVVESFRPGVLERLGLGYDVLSAANPGIVLCRISGWGAQGPLAQSAGHDLNYLAATGLLSFTAAADDPPVLPPLQVADAASGLFAAVGILAALQERARSGLGQVVGVPMALTALPVAAMTVAGVLATGSASPTAEGTWSGGAICYQVYRCADGWVALAALEEKFWRTWCLGVGRADLLESRYDHPGSPAHAAVAAVIASRTRAEWQAFADEHDCCLSVVRGLEEALGSPLLAGRLPEVTGAAGEPPHPVLATPLDLSRTPVAPGRLPAPALGADTADVLRAAGIDAAAVQRLLS